MDLVSETMRCPWREVFDMPAVEFLNIISYRIDRNAHEKAEIERFKRTH